MSYLSTKDPIARPISNEELRARVPSIFAADAHESRSERYTYIPTIDVLDALQKEGFQVVRAQQSRCRDADRRDFTKHLIRLRHVNAAPSPRAVGDVYPEVVLLNSHDGTSAYQLSAGLFRLVCLNGMVVSDLDIGAVKIPHKGDVVARVVEGSLGIIGRAAEAVDTAARWQTIDLTKNEQGVFAEAALVARFGDSEGNVDTPFKAEHMLTTRRRDDTRSDLWTVFNRVQENAIRGGVSTRYRDGNRMRTATIRAVNGIDGDVKLNKALWTLARGMEDLKTAA